MLGPTPPAGTRFRYRGTFLGGKISLKREAIEGPLASGSCRGVYGSGPVEFALQPSLCHPQLPADFGYGHSGCLGRFFGGKSSKEPHLDQPRLDGILAG